MWTRRRQSRGRTGLEVKVETQWLEEHFLVFIIFPTFLFLFLCRTYFFCFAFAITSLVSSLSYVFFVVVFTRILLLVRSTFSVLLFNKIFCFFYIQNHSTYNVFREISSSRRFSSYAFHFIQFFWTFLFVFYVFLLLLGHRLLVQFFVILRLRTKLSLVLYINNVLNKVHIFICIYGIYNMQCIYPSAYEDVNILFLNHLPSTDSSFILYPIWPNHTYVS